MKALLYECPSGISGDMNLAALVDLGVPAEHVLRELAKLHLDDEFKLDFTKAQKQGITGTRAKVTVAAGEGHADHHHDHDHEHGHDHDHDHDLRTATITPLTIMATGQTTSIGIIATSRK